MPSDIYRMWFGFLQLNTHDKRATRTNLLKTLLQIKTKKLYQFCAIRLEFSENKNDRLLTLSKKQCFIH